MVLFPFFLGWYHHCTFVHPSPGNINNLKVHNWTLRTPKVQYLCKALIERLIKGIR